MEGEAKLEQNLFRDRRHHVDDRAVVDSAPCVTSRSYYSFSCWRSRVGTGGTL